VRQTNAAYFDTLRVEAVHASMLRPAAEAAGLNFRYFADGAVGISVDETTTIEDVTDIVMVFTASNRPVFKPGAPR